MSRTRVQLIGGPADGRIVSAETDRGVYEVPIFTSHTGVGGLEVEPDDEIPVELYRRHRICDGWGTVKYVYAHHTLSADDVTEILKENVT